VAWTWTPEDTDVPRTDVAALVKGNASKKVEMMGNSRGSRGWSPKWQFNYPTKQSKL